MSRYTNDTEALRQFVASAIPQLLFFLHNRRCDVHDDGYPKLAAFLIRGGHACFNAHFGGQDSH